MHYETLFMDTPIGTLCIKLTAENVINIRYCFDEFQLNDALMQAESDISFPLGREVEKQINAYFKDPKHQFSLPIHYEGTTLQKQIWQTIQLIPAGKVRSYSEIGKQLNCGPRAVGGACSKNPLPFIIPCHRVVAQNGIGGFCKIAIKEQLLEWEGAFNHC